MSKTLKDRGRKQGDPVVILAGSKHQNDFHMSITWEEDRSLSRNLDPEAASDRYPILAMKSGLDADCASFGLSIPSALKIVDAIMDVITQIRSETDG